MTVAGRDDSGNDDSLPDEGEKGARTKVGGLGGKVCRVNTVFDLALGGQEVHPINSNKRQT